MIALPLAPMQRVAPAPPGPLCDTHGRTIGYLRLSLTPACQMKCVYCRPAMLQLHNSSDALQPSEIEQIVRHMVGSDGLHKVRLTGGDPTARPDLIEIIRRVASVAGIDDLAMTTNGLTLARDANAFATAGLRRINISLDTLDPRKFERMTGVDGLQRVLAGIDAAKAAGLGPIKLNTVVLRDENEADLPSLVRFAAQRDVSIRFIELMPMGPLADVWSQRYVPASRMRQILDPHIATWRPLQQGADSAVCFDVTLRDGGRVVVGFITPMSCNFCAACNRVRVTSDGSIYPCLMDHARGSLMAAIRPHFDPVRLDALLHRALTDKAAEHPHDGVAVMTTIGG